MVRGSGLRMGFALDGRGVSEHVLDPRGLVGREVGEESALVLAVVAARGREFARRHACAGGGMG